MMRTTYTDAEMRELGRLPYPGTLRVIQAPVIPVKNCPRGLVCGWMQMPGHDGEPCPDCNYGNYIVD